VKRLSLKQKMKRISWFSLACGLILLILGIFDAHSTYLAVREGASELNPIVAFFLLNDSMFIFFSIVKCLFYFTIGLETKPSKINIIIFIIMTSLLVNAIITNYRNAKVI